MAWTQLTNNAKTTLSAGCTDVATAITPTAKTTFPDPEDDGSFYVTIWDADTYPDPGDDPGMEIVLVTADAAANWTVTRGQAGTAGAAHVAGDAVRLLWLAEHAQEIHDAVDLNSTHRTTVDAITGLVSGDGAGAYTGVARANLTGTENQVTLTGDGSGTLLGTAIQLGLPQSIHTAGTPQFGKLGLGVAAGTARITLVEGTTAADGIDFGGDATLYRSAANVLSTDDSLSVALGAVINEGGGDYDTRIEGDTDANLIYVDAGNDRVGIGTATPPAKLSLAEGTTAASGIAFGTDVNLYRSAANVLSTDDSLSVALGAVINEGGGDYDTRIEGDTDANLIYVDAGNDRVGIGTATPSAKLSLAEGTTAASGIAFGTDVNLYRSAANVLTLADKLEMGSNIDLGEYALFFGTADNVKLQYTSHASASILNQYSPGGALVNSWKAIRCVEGINNYARIEGVTGSTATPTSGNILGIIDWVITQADPSALKAKMNFYVNTGDSAQVAMTLGDDRSAVFQGLVDTSAAAAKAKIYSQATEPNIANDTWAFWTDTDDGKYYIILDIGGTQKKVELV